MQAADQRALAARIKKLEQGSLETAAIYAIEPEVFAAM
jgi:hypothetical protein